MIAPSLLPRKRGPGTSAAPALNGKANGANGHHSETYPWSTPSEPSNPTVVPTSLLSEFHWIFLIRDPHRSIPSYFRCTIPPLDKATGFDYFDPSEAGYVEVRLVYDYLRRTGIVGPRFAKGSGYTAKTHGTVGEGEKSKEGVELFVLDADDMLDEPAGHIEACCNSIGLPYDDAMLNWDNEVDQRIAKDAFEKWAGFHEDAIDSTCLHAREKKHKDMPKKSEQQWDAEWRAKYGEKGAKLVRETVDACMDDYLYMKQFALHL